VKFFVYKFHLPPNHLFHCELYVVDMKFKSYFFILELRFPVVTEESDGVGDVMPCSSVKRPLRKEH
jgi:hypothetical protein